VDLIKTIDLANEAGVSRQRIAQWSREGLAESAKVAHGKWDREAALSWIADRREDGTAGTPDEKVTLAETRIRLYTLQADGQHLRNQAQEATLVPREAVTQAFSVATGEQISSGDAWARDPQTPACKPLLEHYSAARVLQIKAELWNEVRATQAESIRRAQRTLAVGDDVGSIRIRIPRSVG